MEKLLSEMKMEKKYNRTTRKEDLDIGMEYTIKEMKCITTKYGKKLVITIDFKAEIVDLFVTKRFDSKAADLQKKLTKLDKYMILKVRKEKNKEKINYLDTDVELSTKY